jgi:hypothetical protein
MKFLADRPYADPEAAARKLLEIANTVDAMQDGRLYIELINGPFLFREKGTPDEYKAGLDLAIERGWLQMHESGTYVKFTQAGAELFARGADAQRRPATSTPDAGKPEESPPGSQTDAQASDENDDANRSPSEYRPS